MNNDSKWYFSSEQLLQSPSKKCGMDADTELMYRQRAANLIQDMGQRLQVSQLCINTAIVYMHRFYAFHSFTHFHRNSIAAAALFLAAKVEEQPRKLEHVIKVANICLNIEPTDPSRESYAEQAQDLVFNENVLLQTLGFDVAIDHPHTHVVKTCHLVKASKDLAQTSYFMASNSLHLTTMCLQYKPTVVACFCIHLACLWSCWEIPQSTEGKHWFHYVDKTVTKDLLKQLTDEFLHIFDKCPSRLKSKMKSIRQSAQTDEPRKSNSAQSATVPSSSSSGVGFSVKEEPALAPSSSKSHHRTHHSSSASHHHSKNAPNIPSISASSKSSSSSSKYQQHAQPPIASNPTQMSSSSSNNNQRIKSERSSGDAMAPSAANIYSKDSSSYNANAGSFNKNQLIANSFSANKQAASNMPAMSAQKSGGQPTASDNLSYSNISSKDPSGFSSSMNKMRQQPPQQQQQQQQPSSQRGGTFPNQFDIKQEKSFKNLHSNKVMSTDTMTTLLSAPKPIQPYVQNMSNTGGSSSSGSTSSNSYRHMTSTQQPPALSNLQQHKSNLSIEPDLQPYKFVDDSIKSEASPKLGKPTSIFSPEWKEPAQQMTSSSNRTSSTSSSLGGSNKQTSNKHAVSGSSDKTDMNNSSKMNRTGFNQGNLSYDRQLNPKRFQDLSTINMQQFTNIPMADASSSLLINNRLNKRPYAPEQQQQHQHQQHHHSQSLDNKYDLDNGSDMMRESKVRKTDYFSTTTLDSTTTSNNDSRNNHLLASPIIKSEKNSSTTKVSDLDNESYAKPLFATLSSSSSQASASTLNSSGRSIETNADMVRNLLKESLCSSESKYGGVPFSTNLEDDNKFSIKTEPLLSTDDIFNPGSLITNLHDAPAIEDINHRIKVEKKKKKDKHKHKERSKDKEERKKHKKDKERHKERSDGSGPTIPPSDMMVNDVNQKLPKITIPKDKLNFHSQMSASTTGFKIKIPKDRIKSDLTPNASSRTDSKLQQPSSLKIKISKDMIESYAHPKYD